mmetsp:Transcript_1505/g.2484  ORF Transcript_1505/g.2484 Transcript_1505/m.2484 type:complete len:190 (+) Transcript_1505:37-606(+)
MSIFLFCVILFGSLISTEITAFSISSRVLLKKSLSATDTAVRALSGDEFTEIRGKFENLVEGDKIFRVHSVAAGGFGSLLLLKPTLFFAAGLLAFAYQSWAIFILMVSYLSYQAPNLDAEAKQVIARGFFVMLAGESLLYFSDLVFHIGLYLLSPFTFVITLSSLAVFSALAYGYYISGTTGWKLKELS